MLDGIASLVIFTFLWSEQLLLFSRPMLKELSAAPLALDKCSVRGFDVAPFVQSYLDKTVYRAFPDWAEKLVEAVAPMRLSKVKKVDRRNNC